MLEEKCPKIKLNEQEKQKTNKQTRNQTKQTNKNKKTKKKRKATFLAVFETPRLFWDLVHAVKGK